RPHRHALPGWLEHVVERQHHARTLRPSRKRQNASLARCALSGDTPRISTHSGNTPMTLSLYDVCIPQSVRMLDNVSALIDKAAAHCTARKIDPAVMVNYRLAADMFPFSRQVQIMTDQTKGMAARLTMGDVPSWPDTETTFDELKARLAKAKAYLQS